MNFHWGHKAAIFYLSFVFFMLFLVAKAVNQNFDLVTNDYYSDDLAYQEKIDRANNSKALDIPLNIKYSGAEKNVLLSFPESVEKIEGEIHFYKPDKSNLDIKMPINLSNDFIQKIDFSDKINGLWRVKITWNADGVAYFDENLFVKQ